MIPSQTASRGHFPGVYGWGGIGGKQIDTRIHPDYSRLLFLRGSLCTDEDTAGCGGALAGEIGDFRRVRRDLVVSIAC